MVIRWRNDRGRGQEDQDARLRRVVQPRPGQLDLDQFPQDFNAEVLDSPLVGRFGRICVELAVQLSPCEPLWSPKREGPVGEATGRDRVPGNSA